VHLDHLRLFRDIAHARSVSRGAVLNKISQSAASQHLQELERSLGIELVDRTTRPIRLTAGGQAYLDFCREVLRKKTEFDAALDELKRSASGEVKVASIYSVGLSNMHRLEEAFLLRCTEAQLRVDYLRPEKVYEAIREDRADLGLVSYPVSSREITAIAWRQEKMVLAMPPGHRLSGQQRIDPAQLDGEAFVAFDEDLPIRRNIDSYLREHGAEVDVVMHFDNLQMIKEAVSLGSGVSIVPHAVMEKELADARLVSAELSPDLTRPLGILHRKNAKLGPAAKVFLELLRELGQTA
jgi:LysR family transcriptional regulator, transcriptional activator of the cysJI operon